MQKLPGSDAEKIKGSARQNSLVPYYPLTGSFEGGTRPHSAKCPGLESSFLKFPVLNS
ncbi:MAG TPA: hypothetical protein VGD22_15940 [Sphingobacteriaceae bacterium]